MPRPVVFFLTAALATSASVALAPAPAGAEILQLYAEVHGGGAGGAGIGGGRSDDSFHEGATGMVYGALVGAEVLFVDGWIQHDQFVGGDGLIGTWTQFMVGLDVEFDLSQPTKGATAGEDGRLSGGYAPVYGELGMGVGFGVGTGQQVEPPLNNAQVTDKGFLAQVHAGLGYRLSKVVSLGVTVPVQAGYMFKSGPGIVANDEDTHYQSVQAMLLLNLRVAFTLR
jgi:hypothetical protein